MLPSSAHCTMQTNSTNPCYVPELLGSFFHTLRSAQFHLSQRGEIAQQTDRFSIELTRPVVQHAHGSDAVCSHEYRAAGIEPNSRYLSDQRVVGKSRILKCIWHDKNPPEETAWEQNEVSREVSATSSP
jgi:hypothetical protein